MGSSFPLNYWDFLDLVALERTWGVTFKPIIQECLLESTVLFMPDMYLECNIKASLKISTGECLIMFKKFSCYEYKWCTWWSNNRTMHTWAWVSDNCIKCIRERRESALKSIPQEEHLLCLIPLWWVLKRILPWGGEVPVAHPILYWGPLKSKRNMRKV